MSSIRLISLCLLLVAITIGCKTTQPSVPPAGQESSSGETITGELMILLVEQASPQELEKAFSQFGLVNKGRSSRSQNKFKYTFSTKAATEEEMVRKISDHPKVKSAVVVKPM